MINSATTDKHFNFGKNWERYLSCLDNKRITIAMASLESKTMRDFKGKRFLDIGCGSGLFSLAARNLGANVVSFDYDCEAVACAQKLKVQHYLHDSNWMVEQGSILDRDYVNSLGKFDIVYAWGVLHHTGQMWEAIDRTSSLVKDGGLLYISIYNDQGSRSHLWKEVKYIYNHVSHPIQFLMVLGVGLFIEINRALRHLFRVENPLPFKYWSEYKRRRGMSVWYDLVDWVGGYPFEVAKPEEIFDYIRIKGFSLVGLKTCGGGGGCNEFIFEKGIGK